MSEDTMKKKACIIAMTLLLFGCTEEAQQVEKKMEELESRVMSAERSAQFHEDEVAMYEALTAEMVKKLSTEEMKEFGKLAWQYKLTVNNEPIPKNGIVELKDSDFEFVLGTKQLSSLVLPPDIHNAGILSKPYEEHITNIKPKPNEVGTRDGTVVADLYHTFTNISKGTKINITITEELKERAGLDTTTITIKRI
jgi:hypothetical protein